MVKFIKGGSLYQGNFKSMRKKRVIKDPLTGSEEKGMKRTLFSCCGAAVKALRVGFENLIPHTDGLFTSRLMAMVIHVYKLDVEREMGKKSILFSKFKPILYSLKFRKGENCIGNYLGKFKWSHSDSRLEAILEVKDFQIYWPSMPVCTTAYRFYLHLSVISDSVFSEKEQGYVSMSGASGLNVMTYSEYVPVGTTYNGVMEVSFPEGIVLTDADTVIQCVGFEYCYKSGPYYEAYFGGSGLEVVDVY